MSMRGWMGVVGVELGWSPPPPTPRPEVGDARTVSMLVGTWVVVSGRSLRRCSKPSE